MGKGVAQGVRRRGPAAELVSVLADRPMWGLSGFLDPLNRRVESLQRRYGGQEAQGGLGGVELRRRSNSPAVESNLDSGGVGP